MTLGQVLEFTRYVLVPRIKQVDRSMTVSARSDILYMERVACRSGASSTAMDKEKARWFKKQ